MPSAARLWTPATPLATPSVDASDIEAMKSSKQVVPEGSDIQKFTSAASVVVNRISASRDETEQCTAFQSGGAQLCFYP
jgi:hypothetical protein